MMKAAKTIVGLFILIILAVSTSYAQQQVTQTVTAQNTNCNATCSVIDIPELNTNPNAVLFITQSGGTTNPHPIGAYYMYLSRWSVFNLDGKALPVGAQFKVEYYVNPDPNHFVYSILPRTNTSDPAYIDNVNLNNNPNAQIRVFPHCSSTIGNIWNREQVKVEYDKTTAKWFIANLNATPVTPAVAYNVMFSQGYSVTNENVNKTLNTTPQTRLSPSPKPVTAITKIAPTQANGSTLPSESQSFPTSLPPNGNAGGDLSGTYPNPTVIGLQGKPLSTVAPKIGQTLRWTGGEWEPVDTTILPIFKQPVSPSTVELSDVKPQDTINNISHSITLSKRSMLVITAVLDISGPNCIAGCDAAKGAFFMRVNGIDDSGSRVSFVAGNGTYFTTSVVNYMRELSPGRYDIQFVAAHGTSTSKFSYTPRYSSTIILPLD